MKLLSIQYLRGLAAVLVILAHAADHPLPETPGVLTQLGELGITLFFVISGFIMVAISGSAGFNPIAFLRRRIIRVVPLYWCFTTVAAIMALALPTLFKSTTFTLPHYLLSLFFIPHAAPGRGGFSPLLSLGWTLNYEIFFYLAFATLAVFTAKHRVAMLTLLFTALAVIGLVTQPQDAVLGFYANVSLLAFCAGTWIGLLHLDGRLVRAPMPLAAGLAIAALLALGLGLAGTGIAGYSALLLGCAAVVVLGLATEPRLPRWRLLEQLGDASYSLYLSHIFVVGAVVAIGGRLLPLEGPAGYAALVISAIGAATIVGLLIHHWLEMPLLRLFNRPRVETGLAQSPRPASA